MINNTKQLSEEQIQYAKKQVIELGEKIEFYKNKKNSIQELEEKITYSKKKIYDLKRRFILDKDNVLIEDIMLLEDEIVESHTELSVKLNLKLEDKEEEIKRLNLIINNKNYNKEYLSEYEIQYIKKSIIELEKKLEFYKNNNIKDKINYCDKKIDGFKRRLKFNEIIGYTNRLEDQIINLHTEATSRLNLKLEYNEKEIERLNSIINEASKK